MFDLSDESKSIWRLMRQGSFGTVLWALQRDRQAVADVCRCLEFVDDPGEFAASLRQPIRFAGNSLGQVALHHLAAEPGAPPHVEPRDPRWSIFRVFSAESFEEICGVIAAFPEFIQRARGALSSTIDVIQKSDLSKSVEPSKNPEISELQRYLLIYIGIAIGQAIEERQLDFIRLVGKISEMNEETGSLLYPFSRNTGEGRE